jgi:hypothetical protein
MKAIGPMAKECCSPPADTSEQQLRWSRCRISRLDTDDSCKIECEQDDLRPPRIKGFFAFVLA